VSADRRKLLAEPAKAFLRQHPSDLFLQYSFSNGLPSILGQAQFGQASASVGRCSFGLFNCRVGEGILNLPFEAMNVADEPEVVEKEVVTSRLIHVALRRNQAVRQLAQDRPQLPTNETEPLADQQAIHLGIQTARGQPFGRQAEQQNRQQ
jgi:hypothetical protein